MKKVKTYEDFVNEEINLKKAAAGVALGAGLAFGSPAHSQITTTKVNPYKTEVKNQKYDSLTNFVGEDIQKLVGQTLYVTPLSEGLKEYGYMDFYTKYLPLTVRSQRDTYKPHKNGLPGHSEYESLAGKYFIVLDFLAGTELDEEYNQAYLKLKEKESGDIVYYLISKEYEHSFPFIIAGYFEKLKKVFIGKTFILTGTYRSEEIVDIEKGEKIKSFIGQRWKCVDISIEDEYYTLCGIMKNEFGQKLPMDIDQLENASKFKFDSRIPSILTLPIYNKLLQKYSKEIINLLTIVDNNPENLKIGWTKEMCILAIGNPDVVKKDEFIYNELSSKYFSPKIFRSKFTLYFENGILTSIGN